MLIIDVFHLQHSIIVMTYMTITCYKQGSVGLSVLLAVHHCTCNFRMCLTIPCLEHTMRGSRHDVE